MAKKTKKKTRKKAPRSERRAPWHEAFQADIVRGALTYIVQDSLSRNSEMRTARSPAALHRAFENQHACSIPRDLFEEITRKLGVSFNVGIAVKALPEPAPGDPSPLAGSPITEAVPAAPIRTKIPADEEGGGFTIMNDDAPQGAPGVVSDAEVRQLAAIHEAMADPDAVPEPIIIPRR